MLVIDNKKYRNLQEQVGYNTEQIEKIFDFLDGINVSDNVVVVLDISTPLTTEQLEIVNREVAFIVYNGELYFKRNQDSSNIYFDVVFNVSGGTVITLTSSEITVTKSNGAMGVVTSTDSTYSKTELDTQLGTKSSITYVDSQLATKADLSGANFTGSITAPSIIESMNGYSFENINTDANAQIEYVYVGAVKNGNKLTFVIACNITKLGALQDNDVKIGKFNIPTAVGQQLYPTQIGLYNYLSMKKESVFENPSTSVDVVCFSEKVSNQVIFNKVRVSGFTDNTKYYLRYEVTFLLSDNLAS